ncbi:MAG TPA: hypothetical protein VIR57_04795 [Chloroflexota bacterium]|jgi:2,6-dihydroxypseudooxynicotine hydrolase
MASAQRMYDEAGGPKQLLVIDGGSHVSNNRPFLYRPAIWDFMAKELSAA